MGLGKTETSIYKTVPGAHSAEILKSSSDTRVPFSVRFALLWLSSYLTECKVGEFTLAPGCRELSSHLLGLMHRHRMLMAEGVCKGGLLDY